MESTELANLYPPVLFRKNFVSFSWSYGRIAPIAAFLKHYTQAQIGISEII